MKNTILALITITMFIISCGDKSGEKEKIIEVKDFRNKGLPSPNIAQHKDKDMEVFRVGFTEDSYAFAIYGTENDSLKRFVPFMYALKDDFDKASYHWGDDTTLLVRLYNTDLGNDLHFRLTGNLLSKTGSSMIEILDK